MSNPNFEQFDNRQVPFGGDYLWITSPGNSIKSWSSDLCPHARGIDQDIYGDRTP